MSNWVLMNKKGDDTELARVIGISGTLARVLINRGINNPLAAAAFINPDLKTLEPITQMHGVKEAFEIIKCFINDKNGKICVYGDYDADGVTSSVILVKTFKALGCDVFYYIPEREEEGYGLNKEAVTKISAMGCGLLVTCDNGISGIDETQLAISLGMKVIIIDHHEPGLQIPLANAVIDPKLPNCPYKYKMMCAGGIAYRFATGLLEFLNPKLKSIYEAEFLQLATIATFCDIVDLTGENRVIAQNGLVSINKGFANLGLKTLANAHSLKKKITGYEIGFIIGPCINATGRLDTARLAVELMLTDNENEALDMAAVLTELNTKRKEMTRIAEYAAFKQLAEADYKEKVIVLYNIDIHESIAGIVAGRLRDKLYRPAIVLTNAVQTEGADEIVKGSARSTVHYDIFAKLSECAHLFERFGGHPMAAGLTLKKKNITALKTALNTNCTLTNEQLTEKLYIEKRLKINEITYTLADELNKLAPYGKSNKEALFGSLNVYVAGLKLSFEKDYIRFTLADNEEGRKITGMCFKMTEKFALLIKERYDERTADKILNGVLRQTSLFIDIVYTIDINEYNNDTCVQIVVKDFRLS